MSRRDRPSRHRHRDRRAVLDGPHVLLDGPYIYTRIVPETLVGHARPVR